MSGYTYDPVQEEERLLCGVCRDLMRDAVETVCGHHYCQGCLQQAMRFRSLCPICRQELGSNDVHPLIGVRREINYSIVYCTHKDVGCTHIGPLGEMEDRHLPQCDFNPTDCQNMCGVKVAPRNMAMHLEYSCSLRILLCARCGLPVQFSDFERHIDSCKETEETDENGFDYIEDATEINLQAVNLTAEYAPEETEDITPALHWNRVSVRSSTERKTCVFTCTRQRKWIIAYVIAGSILIIGGALSPTFVRLGRPGTGMQDADPLTLRLPCSPKGDPCSDPSGQQLTCDLMTHTCLLQTGESCVGDNQNACVSGAACDQITTQCVCENDFQIGHVCALKPDETCAGGLEDFCWWSSYCDDSSGRCRCLDDFKQSGDICRLRVQVEGRNCRSTIPCVEHAACDIHGTRQCFCRENFSIKLDRTCGLDADVAGVDCTKYEGCVDHAACDRSSQKCLCQDNFHVRKDGTCGYVVGRWTPDNTCGSISTCVENATCWTNRCECDSHFTQQFDRTCGLNVEVSGADCRREGTSCVQYARCESSGMCVCDSGISAKTGKKCGLFPNIPVKDCATTICVDHTQCGTDSHTGTSTCKCKSGHHWDRSLERCRVLAVSASNRHLSSTAVLAVTTFLSWVIVFTS
ncbi:cell death abnormality protein 1-like isoform X2 [Littorina saxatilis]|uniref:Uncharacterized protein n=1 Tax=Littorina saxatilis TaxID=31220 RepID=A0AAN9AU82_9CAEN